MAARSRPLILEAYGSAWHRRRLFQRPCWLSFCCVTSDASQRGEAVSHQPDTVPASTCLLCHSLQVEEEGACACCQSSSSVFSPLQRSVAAPRLRHDLSTKSSCLPPADLTSTQ